MNLLPQSSATISNSTGPLGTLQLRTAKETPHICDTQISLMCY